MDKLDSHIRLHRGVTIALRKLIREAGGARSVAKICRVRRSFVYRVFNGDENLHLLALQNFLERLGGRFTPYVLEPSHLKIGLTEDVLFGDYLKSLSELDETKLLDLLGERLKEKFCIKRVVDRKAAAFHR